MLLPRFGDRPLLEVRPRPVSCAASSLRRLPTSSFSACARNAAIRLAYLNRIRPSTYCIPYSGPRIYRPSESSAVP
ncbi:hypothetical protein SeMB42_g00504 [Synchytrium endobioticum]|uniref:Uncharacterized protein n=1 Tax=Synchytrium endobioticum TaxID=286115 RepID=A0A507DRU5_9FUNG|nr:hypothetical protein SeMB42_g00504 [Synchytrium endobioticum]